MCRVRSGDLIFGRKSEVASVKIEAVTPSTARVSVTGKLVSWMRTDLRRLFESLGATPPDFEAQDLAEVTRPAAKRYVAE
jgi:hypothetical protein